MSHRIMMQIIGRIGFILWSLNVYSSTPVIKIGTLNVPPHVFSDKVKGVYGPTVNYFQRYVGPQIGVIFSFQQPDSLDTVLDKIKKGELDGGIALSVTPERENFLNFPEKFYYESMPSLLFLKSHRLNKIENITDLKDMKIAYVAKGYVPEYFKLLNIVLVTGTGLDWFDHMVGNLMNRSVEAIYQSDSIVLLHRAEKNKISDKIKILEIPTEKTRIFMAFKKDPKFLHIIERYNRLTASASFLPYSDYLAEYIK